MSGMAEVLARRNFEDEQGKGEWDYITKSEKRGWLKEAQATLDFLAAAGFGPVAEAKAEALVEAADTLSRGTVSDPFGRATHDNYADWLRALTRCCEG